MSTHPSRHFINLAIITLALLTTSSRVFSGCSERVLVNGWGGDWTPFIMGTAQEPAGLDMEILDAVIARAGCQWRNTDEEIPWKRHLKLIELGQLDLATAAIWTEERSNYAYFTEPYRTEYVAIYVLKENYDQFTTLSLQQLIELDFKLGTIRGDVHGETLEQFIFELGTNVSVVDSNSQNVEKLLLKRIDGYIGYPPSDTIELNKNNQSEDIIILPNTVTSTGKVHIMLSKENNSIDVFEALNQAVLDLKKDGSINKIKSKYEALFNARFY